jgi:hypothetical protein
VPEGGASAVLLARHAYDARRRADLLAFLYYVVNFEDCLSAVVKLS